MIAIHIILVVLADFLNPLPVEQKKVSTPAIDIVIQGTLRQGVLAIGAETTGTTITANGMTWDLELPPALKTFADTHHKQTVKASGRLKKVKGTEVPDRWILSAMSIRTVESVKDKKGSVDVTFRGKLRTGILAIGGETTGVELTDDGVTWELDLSHAKNLQQKTTDLHKTTVIAKGRLRKVKGIERPDRFVIRVSGLEATKPDRD